MGMEYVALHNQPLTPRQIYPQRHGGQDFFPVKWEDSLIDLLNFII